MKFIRHNDFLLGGGVEAVIGAGGGLGADPGAEVVVVAYKPQMTEEERVSIDARNAALQALKDEAVRAVKNIPGRWTPGMHEGKPVRVRFTLPVSFRLQ